VVVRSEPTPPGARSTAALSGALDVTGVGGLWAVLDDLHGHGHRHVVLDLSDLDFLDAAGLGVLVRADARFRSTGARLVLTGLRPAQLRLLELTGLDRRLDVG
jgi:anti-sigma B factor antagonist